MIDQIIVLANMPWYVTIIIVIVGGIIGCMVYAAYYHLWKYPNGKPKNKRL